jgi:hypothetical protein
VVDVAFAGQDKTANHFLDEPKLMRVFLLGVINYACVNTVIHSGASSIVFFGDKYDRSVLKIHLP